MAARLRAASGAGEAPTLVAACVGERAAQQLRAFERIADRVPVARIVREDGRMEEVAPKATLRLAAGDQLHVFTAGGAGYGDPLQREPQAVLSDVLDRRVSARAARDDYGVVLALGDGTVVAEETRRLRERMAGERGEIVWTYDLGPELGRA